MLVVSLFLVEKLLHWDSAAFLLFVFELLLVLFVLVLMQLVLNLLVLVLLCCLLQSLSLLRLQQATRHLLAHELLVWLSKP